MTINWAKKFPVVSITRVDVTEFGLTDEEISTLFTDDVMQQIADMMQTTYHLQSPFWEDFADAIKAVIGLEVTTGGKT